VAGRVRVLLSALTTTSTVRR